MIYNFELKNIKNINSNSIFFLVLIYIIYDLLFNCIYELNANNSKIKAKIDISDTYSSQ